MERGDSLSSMTGHGVGEALVGSARVSLEVRSVNHRYAEIRVRLPQELSDHASAVEDLVRRRLVRGRIEVSARLDGEVLGAPVLDVARARAAYEQLVALRDALSPRDVLPLSLLSAVPDLFGAKRLPDLRAAREALESATEIACRGVITMRSREGAALRADFVRRAARVAELTKQVEARAPDVVEAARTRLHERIAKLLAGSGVAVDAARLEQEIVLAADRMDVAEECTRLRSHVAQLDTILGERGDSHGRRIDFLLQEMARESNTIGAKSSDAESARMVVELKTEIERMREQTQNVL